MAKAKPVNELRCAFPSWSANEALARSVAASFAAQLNPTCEEVSDLKCAVSEAVTNAIVHGYGNRLGVVYINAYILKDRKIVIDVKDKGRGSTTCSAR
jgi:stage II sporulation protein AB (anti-sigma F factor)